MPRFPEVLELAQRVMDLERKESDLKFLISQLRFLAPTSQVMAGLINEICWIYEWPELRVEER